MYMENAELEKVVLNSGLELSEGEQIKQSYLPFFIQIAEIKEESKKINFENPKELDEKIARDLRLRMVKIRTASAALKDERKKIHLLRGNLEQSSFNLIKSGCELEEEIFFQVEKKREIIEKLRKENLKNERLNLLNGLCENSNIYPLSEMSDISFNELIEALTISKQQRELKEKKELERIEQEKIEREKQIEAQRLENEKLKNEALKREKQIELERKKQAELTAKIQAENSAKLEIERKESKRLQDEINAKAEVENKIELERLAELAKQTREREKLAKAPIKEKMILWVNSFKLDNAPINNAETQIIIEKFESFKKWAKENIDKL